MTDYTTNFNLISIHALHEESDCRVRRFRAYGSDISIHALHEESDHSPRCHTHFLTISIHALHEESDFTRRDTMKERKISIHALHEESDLQRLRIFCRSFVFQSTLSMRRAT